MNKKVTCVIPARLASTRFPKKVIAPLAGKPLLQWAWEAAHKTGIFDNVVLAIDGQETADVVKGFGGTYLMTSPECTCGTERLIEVMNSKKFDADIWVNWQADEPFITKVFIERLLSSCDMCDADVWTLKKRIVNENEISAPNIAKVVCDLQGYALYFSRSTIPYYRDKDAKTKVFYKHIGIYAYTTEALKKISSMKESELEIAECLEQLRFLQNQLRIKVHETDGEVIGIDTPEDLARAERFVKNG
jgi:3-deoxy-manno-octulosonate cytidylyltransferase (CMP-KDO synthetase)